LQTYVLTKFSCAERPSWLRRKLGLDPRTCRCTMRDMHRTSFCAVRAEHPTQAAGMLGGQLTGLIAGPMFPPDLDQGTFHKFSPGPETFGIVSQAYHRLREPPTPRPGLPPPGELIRSMWELAEPDFGLLLESVAIETHRKLELRLSAELADDDRRSETYLVAVPEIAAEALSQYAIRE